MRIIFLVELFSFRRALRRNILKPPQISGPRNPLYNCSGITRRKKRVSVRERFQSSSVSPSHFLFLNLSLPKFLQLRLCVRLGGFLQRSLLQEMSAISNFTACRRFDNGVALIKDLPGFSLIPKKFLTTKIFTPFHKVIL